MKSWKSSISVEPETYRSLVLERDRQIGSFLSFNPTADVEKLMTVSHENTGEVNGQEFLKDLPFGVKDNIAVRGMGLTCGSRFLKDFVSPYSATAVEKLLAAGAIPVGKTNMDEFGMGSSTDNSALQKTHNPWDLTRVSGGSSGGSAAAVAAGLVPFALGSDTGGSVRQPAAFCGVYGLKPSYGAVSRYGLVAYASSLETIGVLGADAEITRKVFHCIRGRDPMDHSSVDWRDFPVQEGSAKRIGILTGDLGLEDDVAEAYANSIEMLIKLGYELSEVELPGLEYAVPAYYTIATAEASANLARFNGVRYGERPMYAENPDELVRKARSEGFGDEVKLRILLGTYVLRSGFQDRYYHKAQAIREEIRSEFRELFAQTDALMLPVYPVQAFPHGDAGLDSFRQKLADRFTTAANLSGLPALACPVKSDNALPQGVQFMAPAFHEDRLFGIASDLASLMPPSAPSAFPRIYSL